MNTISKPRVLVLGAGFGGLELSTLLSETFGDGVDVTLIDKSDAFVFGFSKLDVMFGHTTLDAVRMPYRNFAKSGVRLVRQTITAIDPERRRVATDGGAYEADFLIVALGADYDFDATPGLAEANEFYTVTGAERLRDVLPTFTGGKALVGVCGAPYKCPPAPSECALMLHDYLVNRGVREACEISFVLPLSSPVPPSPETSRALEAAFAERSITFIPGRRIASIDNTRKVATLDDGAEMPFDLFLGVPKHRVPDVVIGSGMAEGGWIPVNPRTLETRYPGVYAVGDGANTGTPKAGVFAEGAARAVASDLIARLRNSGKATEYNGFGTCYIEFGGGRIGKVEVDFFSGPKPTGTYHEPSVALRADKEIFGSSRRARWFGM
ncbi:FAD-dependent oxidoreductase [Mesorhizobium sp. AR10]|uniref:NAD(P)/FAD-dependent oxidoreductase n=1 Tax=Mesorhizobium sp. AR10 TaxID=2865839 RepID=UPI00215E8B19|nr:FAD-dependent oxidoreductase [Mesorhizobium sp. AR10]UVK40476.1 FAD-dependent oxidoreductase [Mesorhizobium sp. AR10]